LCTSPTMQLQPQTWESFWESSSLSLIHLSHPNS
jgi:hypothetical protein